MGMGLWGPWAPLSAGTCTRREWSPHTLLRMCRIQLAAGWPSLTTPQADWRLGCWLHCRRYKPHTPPTTLMTSFQLGGV